MTPSAQIAGGRRVRRWSRESVIEKIREWNERYGEPPRSADWNPSLARWRAQEWRAERYYDGVWLRAAERRADRAERDAREARRRARRASEREGRARRARDRVQVTERRIRELAAEHVEEIIAEADARVHAAVDQAEAAAHEAADARRARRRAELRAADAELRTEAAERLAPGNGAVWKAAHDAEERAAAAERRARELAVLVCGEARRLTAAELAALRDGGASGPAVLAAALRELGRARASGNGPALEAALTALASAAIRWRDR